MRSASTTRRPCRASPSISHHGRNNGQESLRRHHGAAARWKLASALPERCRHSPPVRAHGCQPATACRSGITARFSRGAADRGDRFHRSFLSVRSPATERELRGSLHCPGRQRRTRAQAHPQLPAAGRNLERILRLAHQRRGRRHLPASIRPFRRAIRLPVPAGRRCLSSRCRPQSHVVLSRHSQEQYVQPSQRGRIVLAHSLQAPVLRLDHGRVPSVLLRLCARVQGPPHRSPDAAGPREHEEDVSHRLARLPVEQADIRAGSSVCAAGRYAAGDLSAAANQPVQLGVYPGARSECADVCRGGRLRDTAGGLHVSLQQRSGRFPEQDLYRHFIESRTALHHLSLLQPGPGALRSGTRRLRVLTGPRFPTSRSSAPARRAARNRRFTATGPCSITWGDTGSARTSRWTGCPSATAPSGRTVRTR